MIASLPTWGVHLFYATLHLLSSRLFSKDVLAIVQLFEGNKEYWLYISSSKTTLHVSSSQESDFTLILFHIWPAFPWNELTCKFFNMCTLDNATVLQINSRDLENCNCNPSIFAQTCWLNRKNQHSNANAKNNSNSRLEANTARTRCSERPAWKVESSEVA